MTKTNNNPDKEWDLFDKVSKMSSEEMLSHLLRNGDYTDDDLEQKDKEDDYNLRKTLKHIKSEALCFFAKILKGIIIFTLGVTSILIVRYLFLIIDDHQQIGTVIGNITSFIFGAASTICIEFFINKTKK